jgi:hypothetical protein
VVLSEYSGFSTNTTESHDKTESGAKHHNPNPNDISLYVMMAHKGNNKITELRTILQRESQNS